MKRSMSKKKKFGLLIAIVAVFGAVVFDQYMKATWDHHITGQMWPHESVEGAGSFFSIKKNQSKKWLKMPLEDRVKYAHLYPEKFEIKKQGKEYVWTTNDNKKLIKRFEMDGYVRNIIFVEPKENTVIKIFENEYELMGCRSSGGASRWTGNANLIWTLENGDKINYPFFVNVYESLPRYLFCDK